jgi:DNA topoisomerase-1
MLAARALRDLGPFTSEKQAKSNILRAIDEVSKKLGNTRTVCRTYYVHPVLLEAYYEGFVLPPSPPKPSANTRRGQRAKAALRGDEIAIVALLRERSGTARDGDERGNGKTTAVPTPSIAPQPASPPATRGWNRYATPSSTAVTGGGSSEPE